MEEDGKYSEWKSGAQPEPLYRIIKQNYADKSLMILPKSENRIKIYAVKCFKTCSLKRSKKKAKNVLTFYLFRTAICD